MVMILLGGNPHIIQFRMIRKKRFKQEDLIINVSLLAIVTKGEIWYISTTIKTIVKVHHAMYPDIKMKQNS